MAIKKNHHKISIIEKSNKIITEKISILEKYKIERHEEITISSTLITMGTISIALFVGFYALYDIIAKIILGTAILICIWTSYYYYFKKPLTRKYKIE